MRPPKYRVNSIFGPTIQGEGAMTGIKTHFLRFSGCNMWSGKPEDREASTCPFCDTDFLNYETLSSMEIVSKLNSLGSCDWVTVTGGEPCLQFDQNLLSDLINDDFKISIETNGTILPKFNVFEVAHMAISPKAPWKDLKILHCHSLKILWPAIHPEITPEAFMDFAAKNKYIQPLSENFKAAVDKVLELGEPWRLGPQLHKIIGVE